MTTIEKQICEDVLKEGKVLNVFEATSGEGIAIISYSVELGGEMYTLTKNDGEWVYFHHVI